MPGPRTPCRQRWLSAARALRQAQRVESGLQHAEQCRRHGRRVQCCGGQPPRRRRGVEHTLVDEHLQQGFHEVRVAVGAIDQQRVQRRRIGLRRQRLQQRRGQRLALFGVERPQLQARARRRARAPAGTLQQFRPRGAPAAAAGWRRPTARCSIARSTSRPVSGREHHHQNRRGERAARPAQVLARLEHARTVGSVLRIPAMAGWLGSPSDHLPGRRSARAPR